MTYARPFRPVDLAEHTLAMFPLEEMIAALRREDAYESGNRNAFTLLHDDGLTAVLTVVREGAECADHATPQPAMIVNLAGKLTINRAGGGSVQLPEGGAAVLAPGVEHTLAPDTDCAYVTIIGARPEDDGELDGLS